MSIRINHLKKKISFSEKNIVLFSNDKFQISSLKNHLSNSEFQYINDILKTSDLKKNIPKGEFVIIVAPNRHIEIEKPYISIIKRLILKNFSNKEVLASDFLTVVDKYFINIRPFFDYMSVVLTTDLNGESLLD